jgi:hypothetical protein
MTRFRLDECEAVELRWGGRSVVCITQGLTSVAAGNCFLRLQKAGFVAIEERQAVGNVQLIPGR